jgi:hypothetical protein
MRRQVILDQEISCTNSLAARPPWLWKLPQVQLNLKLARYKSMINWIYFQLPMSGGRFMSGDVPPFG